MGWGFSGPLGEKQVLVLDLGRVPGSLPAKTASYCPARGKGGEAKVGEGG